MKNSEITIIALGGSLIVPHLTDDGGIDVAYIRKFRSFIVQEIKRGKRFVIVAGGGKTARVYRDAARHIGKVKSADLDWVGIAATKLNAELLRIIFQQAGDNVLVSAGSRPGWSTDYIAMRLAQKLNVQDVVIAGDTAFVYEKDPRKFPKAKALSRLTWSQYENLIPYVSMRGCFDCFARWISNSFFKSVSTAEFRLKGKLGGWPTPSLRSK